MSLIKALVLVRDFTAGDTGLGIDYSLDIIHPTWRQVIDTNDYYFFVYPNDDSILPTELWDAIGNDAAKVINQALIAASQGSLATATSADIFVHGFGDWKAGSSIQPVENIFTGFRERVKRIPRNLNAIVQIPTAQETLSTTNALDKTLKCELTFYDPPNLGTQLRYELFLYTTPADLSDLDGLDSILLESSAAGPPYRIWGEKSFTAFPAALRNASEIHCVLGLRRIATGVDVVPSDAGTIQRGSIAWQSRPLWTPPLLGSKLVLFLDARTLTGLGNGNAIALWTDSSGSSHDAIQNTGTDQPVYRPSEINALPAVDFVSADLFTSTLSASSLDESLVLVMDIDSTAASSYLLSASASGGRALYVTTAGALAISKLGTGDLGTTGTGQIVVDTPVIVGSKLGTTTWALQVNGSETSGTHAETLTASLTTLIGDGSFDGLFPIIIATQPAMTTNERQKVEGFLAHTLGLAYTHLASNHPYKILCPTP